MPLNTRDFRRSWEHHHFPGHFGLKALYPTPFASKAPFEHVPSLAPEVHKMRPKRLNLSIFRPWPQKCSRWAPRGSISAFSRLGPKVHKIIPKRLNLSPPRGHPDFGWRYMGLPVVSPCGLFAYKALYYTAFLDNFSLLGERLHPKVSTNCRNKGLWVGRTALTRGSLLAEHQCALETVSLKP